MKSRTITYAAMLSAMFLCGIQAEGRQTRAYLEDITVSSHSVSVDSGKVTLEMKIDLRGLKIRGQECIELIPVIVSPDRKSEFEFPSVYIDGWARHAAAGRDMALKEKDARDPQSSSVKRRNRKDQYVDYSNSIAYSPAMLDGALELRERTTGCAECELSSTSSTVDDNAVQRYVPKYGTVFMTPAEGGKVRLKTYTFKLGFEQNSAVLKMEYADNGKMLEQVKAHIDNALAKDDHSVKGISIIGYASPEGREGFNDDLSARRAKTFIDVLKKEYDLPDSIWKSEGAGEDWNRMVELVRENPNIRHHDAVMEIAGNARKGDLDRSEKLLMQQEDYGYIYNELFPQIRRSESRIELDVKSYTPEEAAAILESDPSRLSASEMYSVAGQYEEYSGEYNRICRLAAEYNGEDVAVLNNAARACISEGDYEEAVTLLETRTRGNADALNTLGVAYAYSGEYDRAMDSFRSAAAAGSEEAENNMIELGKVLEQLK